jgi:putative transposase
VAGLIQHSDRGSQYAAEIYRKQLAVMAATPSVARFRGQLRLDR